MRRDPFVRCGCLLLALLFGAAGALAAEILCEEPTDASGHECSYLLIAGITEEPDPLNMSAGGLQASAPQNVVPADVAPSDSSPQVVSQDGVTVAVWAETNYGNSDIFFSEWSPDGWQENVLTLGGSDERDPRVDIAGDGAIYVTWWETEAPMRIRVTRRDPESLEWAEPAAFASIYGRHPSILVVRQEVLVAFERSVGSGGQQIVVQKASSSPRATPVTVVDVVASTEREAPLIAELHMQGDRAFLDWIHRTGYFGYSEYRDSGWGASLDTRPLTRRIYAPFPELGSPAVERHR